MSARRALLVLALALAAPPARAEEDAYAAYVRAAPEFQPVPAVAGTWDTWYFMPWRYRWGVGTGEAGGRFCRDHGINGGFTDYGNGPIEWLEKWKLRFYNDHTAGKGILYLRGSNDKKNFARFQTTGSLVRTVPIDAATIAKARGIVRENLATVKKSPMRLAYALDDEISTGAFVVPIPWRLNDDEAAYEAWLARVHGAKRPVAYVTPEYTRAQLEWPLARLDFSPLLDRMAYNDSVWAEFVGSLVRTANEEDPATPCGVVGGQMPSLWGGYDYAKLMKQVQFFEAYDSGSAPEIARSFGRDRGVRLVSTLFHSGVAEDTWQAWRHFAHGQRGMVAWVDDHWFDGEKPRPWLQEFAPVLRELSTLGPKLDGARFRHDGVAIYYSHPSIQVSWCLDSEPHGETWPRRGRDDMLGTASLVRQAWEYLLNDAGLQYDFLAYDEVIRNGVPEEYKALVLPACFALSDAEARRIEEFAARGGRVVADFMCGIFDQHGRGRTAGALDALFGVKHDGTERAGDFFGPALWVETDQEKAYDARTFRELYATSRSPMRAGFAVPERRFDGPVQRGGATYLNLSPQRYLELRETGRAAPRHCALFVDALGVRPWVAVEGVTNVEVTSFQRPDGRVMLFVVQNPPLRGDGTRALAQGESRVTLRFRRSVSDVVDERTGRKRGAGTAFPFEFDRTKAIFVSFAP